MVDTLGAAHSPGAASTPLDGAGDDVLVARAIEGDEAAFAAILRRHTPLMRAYTARIVGSLSEADDVVQEASVIAWRQLSSLREPASVKAWLMRTVSRQAFAYLRRRGTDAAMPENIPDAGVDPETGAIRRAQLDALSRALDRLPADQRQCWMLREVGELSYQEIAAELGITQAQARGKLARARASIIVQMEGWR